MKPVIIVKPQFSVEKQFKQGSKISPNIEGSFLIRLQAGETCTALSQGKALP